VPLLEQVLKKNPGKVKLVFKNFPIRSHKFAQKAAVAALAAGQQGKFWAYHDRLFENIGKLSGQKMQAIATELDLNMQAFNKAIKNPKTLAKVRQDLREGARIGVRGTPAIFINGRKLKNRSLRGFQVLIDKELTKSGVKAAKTAP
jgi:protein-disulfide isomerase